MAAALAGIANFKGEFKLLDSTGKKSLITLAIEQSVNLEQLAHVIQTIPATTTDQQIGFAGVARAKAVYINPNGVAIDVKFEQNTAPAITIDKPSVILGEITAIYVTTAADAVCLEVIVGGPAT